MLEAFTSVNGAKHYKMELNKEKLKISKRKNPLNLPEYLNSHNQRIKIFHPNFPIYWEVE